MRRSGVRSSSSPPTAISSKVPGGPGKSKKPLRINALGLFSCPRRSQEIPSHRSSYCRNFGRSGKIPAPDSRSSCMARFILSTATLKAIKNDDSRGRLRDGDGLYLRLFVNGGSHGWRFDYTFRGKRNTLSLGTYPRTTLKAARQKAEETRRTIDAGKDPSGLRKAARAKVREERAGGDAAPKRACRRSIRSRRLPASGTRRTRRTGLPRTPKRSSGASSSMSSRGSARSRSHPSDRPTCWRSSGESSRAARSKRRTASSRPAARSSGTPSRRCAPSTIRVGTCAAR